MEREITVEKNPAEGRRQKRIALRTPVRILSAALMVIVAVFSMPVTAQAQYEIFGRNKVQYDSFDWKIINTPHFTIHYYEGMEDNALDAARIAERSYDYLSQALQVRLENRIPVLLYADHQDFRQTNAVTGVGEGTQGVTESLKQRMVMPLLPSMEEFTHVFTHELVHAFQLEMLGVGNSMNPLQWSPPLWMMEGMAEYLSIGMDPNTRVWLRDMVQRDDFITLTEFETVMDQRVYRLGQGLYHFLGTRYGVESVRKFFKETIRTRSWVDGLQRTYSKSPKDLSEEWKVFLKNEFSDIVEGNDEAESIATPLIKHEGLVYNINVTPSISPDGERIAYIANQDLRDAIYIANSETGKRRKALAHGGSSRSLEMIDFFESTMSWSDDGQTLAFVSSGGSEDVIHLVDSRTGKTREKLRYKGMSIVSAALSPDGSQVVFSGMINGGRDLYVASTSGGQPHRLTDDIYAYLHPSWSPDASRIAVATDLGAPTDPDNLDFRGLRLALVDPETGDVELLTGGAYHDINPVWSPDGETLAFVSDRAGVPQLFLYDLDKHEIRKITNLVTGVTGITASSPAISWSRESGMMAFSTYREMGWDIYTMPDPRTSATTAEIEQTADPGTEPFEPLWAGYELGNPLLFEADEYSTKIQADYIFGGGAFASNIGVMGDVVIGLSDMLGNHNIILQLGLYGQLSRSNLMATYINMTRRLNWGVMIYQQAMQYGGYYTTFNYSTYLSRTYRGAALMGLYPLNVFSRLEASVGGVNVQEDVLSSDFYGRTRVTERLGRYTWAEASLGHVHDSALYFISGPIGGQRWRFTLYQTMGDLDQTVVLLDFRKYFTINHRGALALKTMTGNTLSNEGQYFRIGGPFTVHATSWGQMVGTNMAVQNVELRYPLLPWLPIQWDFLTGALFADVGAVWDQGSWAKWEPVDYSRDQEIRNGVVGAVGAGVRANLGWLTLFFDYSRPTDFSGGFGPGIFQFAIGQIF